MSTARATRHALYRFYADDGRLLYVGITNNPGQRFTDHAGDKPWWHEVRGISVETYDDRHAVLAAEKRAILVEQPVYNRARPKRPTHRPTNTTARRLVWVCEVCRQPVPDGKGYLHVALTAVHQVEHAWDAYDERSRQRRAAGQLCVDMGDVLSLPSEVPWLVHHLACDPDPDHYCYWFDVARARTHAQLLNWTAHLMESKTWVVRTDWHKLIDRMAGVDA